MKIGINGFGRIGRGFLRELLKRNSSLEVVAINDITDSKTLAHLFKYDSVHKKFDGEVEFDDKNIYVNGKKIKIFSILDPSQIPWADEGIEVVLESTGKFAKAEDAKKHLKGSVRNVVVSTGCKGADLMIVMGCNDNLLDKKKHIIISNASCTTNCAAITMKSIMDRWYLVEGYLVTVHSYTNDQRILDLPHKDLRRARAASLSIIPTSTGAAKNLSEIWPELKGKMNGISLRVPTPNVSITNLVLTLKESPSKEEVNKAFKEDSEGKLRGLLGYTEEEIVSSDLNGDTHSGVVDGLLTDKVGEHTISIFSWYDNETGYNNRLIDVVEKLK